MSGATASTKRMMGAHPERFGVLLTPSNGNREWWGADTVWACDNDWFRDLPEVERRANFLRMLAKVIRCRTAPAWVSCPDAVGDAAETLRRFAIWGPLLAELGLPAALVGQDGLTSEQVPWDRIACLFVGGSTAWKESPAAFALTSEAHRRGKLVHFGRVNTERRIALIARAMRDGLAWCDTFDGTGFSAFGDKRMPKAVKWVGRALAPSLLDQLEGVGTFGTEAECVQWCQARNEEARANANDD